jgi:phage-related protein
VPGPSVTVRLLADLSGLASSFKSAAATGASTGKGLKDAFSPALNALNQTGVLGPFNDALLGVGATIETVKDHIHDLPLAMAGAGAGLAGIGVGLSALGSKDQAAHQQLQAAVEATGKSYSDYSDQVDAAIKHQEHFGTTAATTQDALRILTQATGSPAKAFQELGVASDLAAAKHESLSSAATQLGKAYNGNTRIFKEFGIQVDSAKGATSELNKANTETTRASDEMAKAQQKLGDTEAELAGKKKLTTSEEIRLRDAHAAVTKAAADQQKAHQDLTKAQADVSAATNANGKALDQLGAKLKGQASASADTFGGHIKALKAAIEDNVAAFGQKYGPALQGAGAAMAGLGTAMKVGQAAMAAARDAALGTRIELTLLSVASKVQTAAQWLLNAAMDANPIVLIGLAIAALIAGIVLLVTHTKILQGIWKDIKKVAGDVWHFILDAVKAVWNWIQANWPLLLGILLGPIGLAAALIYKYWDDILAGIKAVWNWIKDVWTTVYDDLVRPLGRLVGWLAGLPAAIIAIFKDAITWLFQAGLNIFQGLWNGLGWIWARLWGWISGAPGAIIRLFDAAINWLFQAGLNILQGLWNGLLWIWGKLWGWISGIPGQIIRLFDAAIIWLFQAGLNILQGLWNGLSGIWARLWGWISGAPNAIIGLFKNAINWLTGAGGDILQGLFNGISNAMKDIGNWVKHVIVDPLVEAVKHFFGVRSPSTVFADIGRNLIAGFIQGFQVDPLDIAKTVFGTLPAAAARIIGAGLIDAAKLPVKAAQAISGAISDLYSFGTPAQQAEWAKALALANQMQSLGPALSNMPSVQIGQAMAAGMGWTGALWNALFNLWQGESGWNPLAYNASSGATGIPQALPGDKMASVAPDWRTNPVTQIAWGLQYIKSVYGDPGRAYALWLSRSPHWYDQGGILPPGITLAMNNTGRNEYVSTTPPRTGPAVVINQATFNSDIDVETFMRRAAWVMQTAKV